VRATPLKQSSDEVVLMPDRARAGAGLVKGVMRSQWPLRGRLAEGKRFPPKFGAPRKGLLQSRRVERGEPRGRVLR